MTRAIGAIAVALVVGAASVGAQVPTRLSDAEFRALIASTSEAGGIFRMGNNFTSNELDVSRMASRLITDRDTGGVYLGVGPEQNYSYIAAVRPRMAFLVDIRRQGIVEHLMYKALFEMATDRADFISLLFARPRPAGTASAGSIQSIWEVYWPVKADTAFARATHGRIVDRLTRVRGIALDSTDAALLRYVYASFVSLGPMIDDEPPPTDSLSPLLAAAWSNDAVATTVVLRDAISGDPIPFVTAEFASATNSFGDQTSTDSAGRLHLPPYPTGSVLSFRFVVYGYDTLNLSGVRLERSTPTLTYSLVRSPLCQNPTQSPVRVCSRSATMARGRASGGVGAAGVIPPARGRIGASARVGPIGTVPAGIDVGMLQQTYYGGLNFAAMTASVDLSSVPRSFLATEAAFHAVKQMHENNLIVPVVADFTGPTALRAIGKYIRDRGATVSAFYVSNVLSYLWTAKTEKVFFENAATLPITSASVIIDAGIRKCSMGAWIAAGMKAKTTSEFSSLATSSPNGVCWR